jgi:hypothetical protein
MTTKPATWIPVLPRPGVYQHAIYGPIEITPERIARFVTSNNYETVDGHNCWWTKKNPYGPFQTYLPVTFAYGIRNEDLTGWLIRMRENEHGGADALVEWLPERVIKKLSKLKSIGIGPEWFDTWTDPMTDIVHCDVMAGVNLTTAPFFDELRTDTEPILAAVRQYQEG